MNKQKLMNMALGGVDACGYQLDQMGITGKINRHNLAAFLMSEQNHLQGEWDSIQVRLNLRRSRFEQISRQLETRTSSLIDPVMSRINRFRPSQ